LPESREMKKGDLVLQSENLFLRPLTIEDVTPDYVRWMNDPEVNRYMGTRYRSQSRADVESYVRTISQKADVYFFAILVLPDKRHIGNIKLELAAPIHQRGELSLFIGERALWGKGLATEAISLVRDFGLHHLKLHKLTAGCFSNHKGSARAFEKAGFTHEATLREQYQCDGEWVDRWCYALLGG
jgi:[ribosomal protein S5]-alanine N-acetyltransferase